MSRNLNQLERSIRVALVDDHPLVRAGIRASLSDVPEIHIVGEAISGEEFLRMSEELKMDVALLDLRLKDMSGIEVCRRLRGRGTAPAVLLLTSFADMRLVHEAESAGVAGYLLKDVAQDNLASAIVRASRGEQFTHECGEQLLAQGFLKSSAEGRGDFGLSSQQRKLLDLVSAGMSNKEIADTCKLSPKTVRNYLSSAFERIGAASRTEAVVIWLTSTLR